MTPQLHPAPGRAILRIVPRLGLKSIDEAVRGADLKTSEGLALALDGGRANQPMVGSLQALGDPTNEREAAICKWASAEAEAGHMFVFSQFGAGTPYWEPDMASMQLAGYDFRWLQGFRLFDIGQLSATISGAGTYGEKKPESLIVIPELQLVQ